MVPLCYCGHQLDEHAEGFSQHCLVSHCGCENYDADFEGEAT